VIAILLYVIEPGGVVGKRAVAVSGRTWNRVITIAMGPAWRQGLEEWPSGCLV
jgi:hypothetical protein